MEDKLALIRIFRFKKGKGYGTLLQKRGAISSIWFLSMPNACGSETIRDKYMMPVYDRLQQSPFKKAFACQTGVELLKSIKMGDDVCPLHNLIWQSNTSHGRS